MISDKDNFVFVEINGNSCYFSAMCGIVENDKALSILAIMPKTYLKYIEVGKDYLLSPAIPHLVNGVFSLGVERVFVREFRECDDTSAKDKLTSEMEKHNMYLGKITYEKEYFRYNYGWTSMIVTAYGLLWKDKGLFPIKINGKVVLYKDLNKELLNDKYITLYGDNGYSLCWQRNEKAENLIEFIDKLFENSDKTFANARVFCGEHCGYHFDELGRLVINLTEKPAKEYSVVSNT